MDYNVIQSPELVRRIRNGLGIRQAHTTPTLNEGIQVVVIADDLRDQKGEVHVTRRAAMGGVSITSVAGQFPIGILGNPLGSGVILRVNRARVYCSSTGPVSGQLNHKKPLTGFTPTFGGFTIFLDIQAGDAGTSLQTKGTCLVQSAVANPITAHQDMFQVRDTEPFDVELPQTALIPDTYLALAINDPAGTIPYVFQFSWTEEPITP